jgi:hypothetical protein
MLFGARLGLIDLQRAAAEAYAVEPGDRLVCVLIRHLDEAEAARFTCLAIRDDPAVSDRTEALEQGP